jgi:hypothetical protein
LSYEDKDAEADDDDDDDDVLVPEEAFLYAANNRGAFT